MQPTETDGFAAVGAELLGAARDLERSTGIPGDERRLRRTHKAARADWPVRRQDSRTLEERCGHAGAPAATRLLGGPLQICGGVLVGPPGDCGTVPSPAVGVLRPLADLTERQVGAIHGAGRRARAHGLA